MISPHFCDIPVNDQCVSQIMYVYIHRIYTHIFIHMYEYLMFYLYYNSTHIANYMYYKCAYSNIRK